MYVKGIFQGKRGLIERERGKYENIEILDIKWIFIKNFKKLIYKIG